MTITQQDKLLAERIQHIIWQDDVHPNEAIAAIIAEAREAQHKASWAMAMGAAASEICEVYGHCYVQDCLSALPTPPITNEGE